MPDHSFCALTVHYVAFPNCKLYAFSEIDFTVLKNLRGFQCNFCPPTSHPPCIFLSSMTLRCTLHMQLYTRFVLNYTNLKPETSELAFSNPKTSSLMCSQNVPNLSSTVTAICSTRNTDNLCSTRMLSCHFQITLSGIFAHLLEV